MVYKKDDSISICDSLFRYLDKKKVNSDVKRRALDSVSKEISKSYDISNNSRFSSPLDYIESKKRNKK